MRARRPPCGEWLWRAIGLTLLLSLSLFAHAADRAASPGPYLGIVLLDRAEFIESDFLPFPTARGQTVALPDNWRLRAPALSAIAWYRLAITLTAPPSQPLALYVPHLSMAGEVWLNGALLNPGVGLSDGAGRHASPMPASPLYLVLPAGLFHRGENQLFIKLQGDSRVRSGLSAIRLGPTQALYRQWLQRYAMQVAVPYILLVLIAGAVCFLPAYARRRRRRSVTPLAFIASLVCLLAYPLFMAVSPGVEEGLRAIAATLMFWALCVEGYRLSGARLRFFTPLLHGVTLLTIAVVVLFMLMGLASDRIWLLTWPHVLLRLVPIFLLLIRGWRTRSLKLLALAFTALLWTLCVAQSYLLIMEWLPWDDFSLGVIGALPFCLMLIFFFAEQFIIDKEESLKAQGAAVAAERARILQDMHDGMGAQLITALRLARSPQCDSGELARHIEQSLQDLRLIIDSLDMAEHDLLPLLGNLRFRLQPRLTALGIGLQWDISPIPSLDYLTPASALSILRIVQEAINNALQHAQPSHIRIEVKQQDDEVLIRVADDGNGMLPDIIRPGARGLSGMRARADKLGMRLSVRGGPGGTEIALYLPLLGNR